MCVSWTKCVCRVIAIGAVWAVAATSLAQPPRLDDAPAFEGMRARWAEIMNEFNVPGMAVAIVKDGRILAIETFGVRTPGENGSSQSNAPTPDTMYYIASITKTYLATAI